MNLSGVQTYEKDLHHVWSHTKPYQRRLSPQIFAAAALLTDAILLMLDTGLLCCLHRWDSGYSAGEVALSGGMASAVCFVALSRCGAYKIERLAGKAPWLGLLVGAVSVGTLLLALDLAMLPAMLPDTVRSIGFRAAVWAASALLLLSGAHALLARLYSVWNLSTVLRRRVVLAGTADYANIFIDRVTSDPDSGIDIVGVYGDAWSAVIDAPFGKYAAGDLHDLVARCRHGDIDTVVLTVPLHDTARIDRIRHVLRDVIADIYVAADILGLRFGLHDLRSIGRTPVVSVRKRPLDEWQQLQKAVFDRVLGAMLLLALLPVLSLVAVMIRLDSPGPVLFRQPRLGFNNRVFTVYKFRTMYAHTDPRSLMGERQARRDDPRVTQVGKWLRKYSIDEIPQLLNVLKGEMSLVGPRPHPLNTRVGDQLFHEAVDNYAARHRVLPGITGWAQVNGWRGETTVLEQIEQRVLHDLFYIDNWSIGFDIRILVLTLTREIFSKNAF